MKCFPQTEQIKLTRGIRVGFFRHPRPLLRPPILEPPLIILSFVEDLGPALLTHRRTVPEFLRGKVSAALPAVPVAFVCGGFVADHDST